MIGDVDLRLAEAFQAPEGVWAPEADRIRLDVFALGALAYFVLAGRPPARDRASLRERLRRDRGLDLAADLPQVAADTGCWYWRLPVPRSPNGSRMSVRSWPGWMRPRRC